MKNNIKYFIPLLGFFIFLKEGTYNTLHIDNWFWVFIIQSISFIAWVVGLSYYLAN